MNFMIFLFALFYSTSNVLSYTYSYNNGNGGGGNNGGGYNGNGGQNNNNGGGYNGGGNNGGGYNGGGNNGGGDNGGNNGGNNGGGNNEYDFIELLDVSDTAFNDETHGGSFLTVPGIAVFDCNNDGYEDIFFASQENEYHKLFINNGDFTFSEEAVKRGFDQTLGSYTPIAFDFDNNGDIDIALSYVGGFNDKGLQFYYNIGNCQFEDRTSTILASVPELWTGGGLSASDYDHDGDLDLIVNSRGSTPVPRDDPIHAVSGFTTIWRNTLNDNGKNNNNNKYGGNSEFTFEILGRSSPPIPDYIQFTCVSGWEDFDEDGYDDVVIGVCGDPFGIGEATYLWKNNYPQNYMDEFIDVTQKYGLGQCNKELLESNGPQFPMSISYGHLDDDDNHFDLFTTNAGTPALYTMYKALWDDDKNQFLGYEAVDVEGFNYDQFSWGANFIDLDNDGKDDIITVGSFVSEFGGTPNPGYVYQNKCNSGRNKYIFKETQTLGLEWSSSVVANGDFDNDGYRDIVVNTVCDAFPLNSDCEEEVPLKIYRNNGGDLGRDDRYYLDVALRGNGIGTNYYGVGSIIEVNIPKFRFTKTGKIRVGADGGNTNSIYAHFGIINKNKMRLFKYIDGKKDVKAEICVKWMGKDETNECFNDIDLNQRIILTQGQGN